MNNQSKQILTSNLAQVCRKILNYYNYKPMNLSPIFPGEGGGGGWGEGEGEYERDPLKGSLTLGLAVFHCLKLSK